MPRKGTPANALLRCIPQVEKVLRLPAVSKLAEGRSRGEVAEAVRGVIEKARREALGGEVSAEELSARFREEGVVRQIEAAIAERSLSAYRRVINATGVVLHTGLGRAPYSAEAVEAFGRELCGYSLVEVDARSGERNRRERAIAPVLRKLTGAEAATVVNNNAAATLLILAALARGKEVIVSRGQLVEIGGSFRVPDILKESGAKLVEVGTTNRTYIEDYRRAITPETAMLLQVHTSNYEIAGFVHHTPLEELAALGRERGLVVVSDLGSGCFVDLTAHGFKPEPLAAESVRAGADLVCFSGDKLLGGPQAGIIVGRAGRIDALRAHPLFRAMRVDKAVLVILESTLRAYLDPERLEERIPTLRLLGEPADRVRRRASTCAGDLRRRAQGVECEVVPTGAQAGSGALPAQEIPSFALAVSVEGLSADDLARELRLGEPPIFSRIHEGRVLLDFRTVLPGEEHQVAASIAAIAAKP